MEQSRMMTFRSILCAVDFSEHSRHALRWADRLRSADGRLTVVTAVDPLLSAAARTRLNFDLLTAVEQELQEFISSTLSNSSGPTTYRAIICEGQPDLVIRKVAGQEQADLIVVGTQGLGGIRKWLLGSTTQQVIRATRIPVFAVPLLESPESRETPNARSFDMTRILAATDFSVPGNYAVSCAADLAGAWGASLMVAHIVPAVAIPPRWRSYVEGVEEENVERARARLEQLKAGLAIANGLEPIVTVGRPADGISEIARQRHAQLIVLGIVGDAWDMAHRPGSIAYRVLCLAHVPVLAIPPPGHAASPSSGHEDGGA